MFDYPVAIPKNTLYAELGVSPDAPMSDIERAKDQAKHRAAEERRGLQRHLADIHAAVPGLEDAEAKIHALQARADVSDADLREARVALARLETEAMRIHPDFPELRGKIEALAAREEELNGLAILNRESREKYDDEHPPMALLKLEDCTQTEFLRPKAAIGLLRREMNRSLEATGEAPFYPSDLLRDDFTSDFIHHPLLDE